jgi:hypothetical protein
MEFTLDRGALVENLSLNSRHKMIDPGSKTTKRPFVTVVVRADPFISFVSRQTSLYTQVFCVHIESTPTIQ